MDGQYAVIITAKRGKAVFKLAFFVRASTSEQALLRGIKYFQDAKEYKGVEIQDSESCQAVDMRG